MRALERGSALEGRYVIRALIGSGSFGLVYSALDREVGEDVAVKTLLPRAVKVKDLLKRFEREAEICAQLTHESTARLRHFGAYRPEGGGPNVPFMVFDLVRGLPVGQLLTVRPPLSVEETCAVLITVLESLGEAHSRGILHRDLKPDNVLVVAPPSTHRTPQYESDSLCEILGIPEVDDPVWRDLTKLETKVVDFGLGKVLEIGDRRVAALTAAGVAPGTAHYMSPEQAQASDGVDYRTDIYGVAMLMHKLLTGRETYEANTAVEVSMKHVAAPLPPLPPPYTHHPIAAVFARAGAKNADERYGSAAEMSWALQCILDPALLDQSLPNFASPPEINARRRGLFTRLFGR